MPTVIHDFTGVADSVTVIEDDLVPAMMACIGTMRTAAKAIGRAAPTADEARARMSGFGFTAKEIAHHFDSAFAAAEAAS